MRIALAQFEVEPAALSSNVDRAVSAVREAADRGAGLVCLPELFTVGYFAFDSYARRAEPLDGPTLTRIAEVAREQSVAVVAGSVVEDLAATGGHPSAEEGYANTCVVFDAAGERRAVFRKHHLFGYDSREQQLLEPGESLAVADLGEFTVGVTTCYDLRFPALYREYVDRGVTLMCVPSAWPYPRVEHFETLARARAIENQFYLATCNGAGEFDDATLCGRSTAFDPWGVGVASSDDEPTTVYADLDPGRVERVREEFPALADRRY
jgi:predicted amidohydrolase